MKFYAMALTLFLPILTTTNLAYGGDDTLQAMRELKTVLDHVDYNSAAHKIVGFESIFDQDYRPLIPTVFKDSPTQRAAINFFMFGKTLSAADVQKIFSTPGDSKALSDLQKAKVIEKDKEGGYRMNGLSVLSYDLPSAQNSPKPRKQTMYIISDQPQSITNAKMTSGEVSTTSHILLGKITDLRPGTYNGLGADFGSGVGIQGIALLKTQPGLQKVYGLEIDKHEMDLSKLNAQLNGVESRFEVIDNLDVHALNRSLGGRKLDIAVSNPPFNIVPREYEKAFDSFGGGGPEGLDVTRIFLDQLKENLKPNGEFIFYSQLAQGKDGHYLVEQDILKSLPKGYAAKFVPCDFPGYSLSQDTYADAFAMLLTTKMGYKEASLGAVLSRVKYDLQKSGIEKVVPVVVDIKGSSSLGKSTTLTTGADQFCAGLKAAFAMGPLPKIEPNRGGIYIQWERVQGGERIERLTGEARTRFLGGEMSKKIHDFLKEDQPAQQAPQSKP